MKANFRLRISNFRQVNARMFAFEPGLLRVNRGDTIVLTVESEDVVHGLYDVICPAYRI